MLDLRFIRANLDTVRQMLKNRCNDLNLSVFGQVLYLSSSVEKGVLRACLLL